MSPTIACHSGEARRRVLICTQSFELGLKFIFALSHSLHVHTRYALVRLQKNLIPSLEKMLRVLLPDHLRENIKAFLKLKVLLLFVD